MNWTECCSELLRVVDGSQQYHNVVINAKYRSSIDNRLHVIYSSLLDTHGGGRCDTEEKKDFI